MKTLALLLLSISCAFGQTNTTIETAFELEFDSSPGVLYAIEASADMVTWQQIDKVYGAADRTQYLTEKTAEQQFFRVSVLPETENWIEGTWSGNIVQALTGSTTFRGTFKFDAANQVYTASYTLPCDGVLAFVSQDERTAIFSLTSDECTNGTVTFRRLSPNLISYQWVHVDGASEAVSFGLLRKEESPLG